jgi:hypothetical protein
LTKEEGEEEEKVDDKERYVTFWKGTDDALFRYKFDHI